MPSIALKTMYILNVHLCHQTIHISTECIVMWTQPCFKKINLDKFWSMDVIAKVGLCQKPNCLRNSKCHVYHGSSTTLFSGYEYLNQCFSTGVPRRTSMPSNSSRCAAKSYIVWYSMQNVSFYHHFAPSITLWCPTKLFYKISVP